MTRTSFSRLVTYLWLLVNAKFERLNFSLNTLLKGLRPSINPDEKRWVVTRDGVRRVQVVIYRNEAARSLSLRGGKSPVLINWHG
jgi:hypothetical protein